MNEKKVKISFIVKFLFISSLILCAVFLLDNYVRGLIDSFFINLVFFLFWFISIFLVIPSIVCFTIAAILDIKKKKDSRVKRNIIIMCLVLLLPLFLVVCRMFFPSVYSKIMPDSPNERFIEESADYAKKVLNEKYGIEFEYDDCEFYWTLVPHKTDDVICDFYEKGTDNKFKVTIYNNKETVSDQYDNAVAYEYFVKKITPFIKNNLEKNKFNIIVSVSDVDFDNIDDINENSIAGNINFTVNILLDDSISEKKAYNFAEKLCDWLSKNNLYADYSGHFYIRGTEDISNEEIQNAKYYDYVIEVDASGKSKFKVKKWDN